MDSLLKDYSLDLRVRLETKIRDANRTLTNLSSERRKEVDIDGVHRAVFSSVFPNLPHNFIFRDLSSLTQCLTPASLLRIHSSGDFCLVAPLQQANESLALPQLLSFLSSSHVPCPTWLTEGFSVRQGQVFVPLCRHGDSLYFQVLCPYPGRDSSIQEDHYPELPLPLTLPMTGDLRSGSFPFLRDYGRAVLHHVRSGDRRVCVVNERARRIRLLGKEAAECEDLEKLAIGDKLVLRGKEYVVQETEFNPYMPYGMQQVVVDNIFPFTSHNVPARVHTSVLVRCQLGLVPESFLHDFEPATIDFSPTYTNCGRLSLSFSTLSFNMSLASHRNPFSFCTSHQS